MKEDKCCNTQKLRHKLELATPNLGLAHQIHILHEARDMHGKLAFLGRDVRQCEWNDVIHLLAGHFMEMPIARNCVQHVISLLERALGIAERHNSRSLWEEALELAAEIKRLTHVHDCQLPADLMGCTILELLLKLH